MALQWLVRLVQPRYTVGVVGVVLDTAGERALLVEHVFHSRHPWGLPGGWIKRGETPAQTAEREIGEETGLRVRAVRPLIIQPGAWGRHLDVVFLCALDGEGQTVRLSGELLSYCWTPLDDLPPLSAFHRQGLEAALGQTLDRVDQTPSKDHRFRA